ncbi:hypothetical protein RclHR1_06510007 [Rhizophagus clarus]|uniref:Uncharacterized protein n=1 Tax=Rhizophagus clarus TaxID=94130 RepID=A0A2Z6S909_9GLOM|nr:hypothetical protein RclHR1_06510007 [Rhizophagus clarus]
MSKIKDYRDNKPPFNLDESCSLDDPLNCFYGIEKNDICISETEMNIQIAEALAEINNDDNECDVLSNESLPNQITVPSDNCVILIEHV